MNAFAHMTDFLIKSDAFKDTDFLGITEKEYSIFLKEFVFEKLQGKKLGKTFAEKFKVNDRVLYIMTDDEHAISHIKYCNYIK
jgi:hypothetical protein